MAPKKNTAAAKDAEAAEKRKGEVSNAAFRDYSAGKAPEERVNPGRVRVVRSVEGKEREVASGGPVIYWMSRDQRVADNWALLYAVEQARDAGVAVAVAFNLLPSFLGAKARHFGFMLRGLRVVETKLKALGIPFFLFKGKAEETISEFAARCGASLVVMDYSPLRIGKVWREGIAEAVGPSVAVHEVDAHCTVPVWVASDKLEYSARTIRQKIHKRLPEYLVEYPPLKLGETKWSGETPAPSDWDQLIADVCREGQEVPEVDWIESGEDAAMAGLLTPPKGFLTPQRLKAYSNARNDPGQVGVLSGLSPWLHYGHISQQRCALEARKKRKEAPQSVDAFLEELVVRSCLAENYCYYQPKYDSVEGAWEWAQTTLRNHAGDKREFLFTYEQLEKGKTYDELWNAAQLEMVHMGKMHGFMRMYWAKKILEWTPSPEEALAATIALNDKYSLDGRDPNGYVGCMWSICGIHDQGWGERPVFGKIRYMNYAGCKRKFNIEAYVALVNKMVARVEKERTNGRAPGTSVTSPSKPNVLELLQGKKGEAAAANGKKGVAGGVKREAKGSNGSAAKKAKK
eukprot:TRINITY_DN6735_c0_g2_i1.p1 TRINITY_DN6735_c0_g2~~TRINITY_DN6735_c0_g2_i1.p1  ORF type:complete len:573 (-),score=116.16 TRINITY_DN6735_c0_g2_i1:73-1791(-)